MALSAPVNLRLPSDTEARLRNLSIRSGKTVSELVRRAVANGIDELEAHELPVEAEESKA